MAQLFLLREALIKSTTHPIYYKELANKLRLLIYEQSGSRSYKPLLLILADRYEVSFEITLRDRWPSSNGPLNDPSDFKTIPFREYLSERAFGRGLTIISRSQLIADVANQIGGAHEDLGHAEYLRPISAPIKGIPYLLEVLQEIAVKTLLFGAKVVEKVAATEGSYPATEDLNDEPIAPSPSCDKCRSPLGYADFVCPSCGAQLIQLTPEPPLVEQFRRTLIASECETAECAMLVGFYSIPDLFNRSAGYGRIIEYSEEGVTFLLDRTEDFHLVFTHIVNGKNLSVAVDLTPVPSANWFMLALTWSPSSVGLYVGVDEQVFSNEFKEIEGEQQQGNHSNAAP